MNYPKISIPDELKEIFYDAGKSLASEIYDTEEYKVITFPNDRYVTREMEQKFDATQFFDSASHAAELIINKAFKNFKKSDKISTRKLNETIYTRDYLVSYARGGFDETSFDLLIDSAIDVDLSHTMIKDETIQSNERIKRMLFNRKSSRPINKLNLYVNEIHDISFLNDVPFISVDINYNPIDIIHLRDDVLYKVMFNQYITAQMHLPMITIDSLIGCQTNIETIVDDIAAENHTNSRSVRMVDDILDEYNINIHDNLYGKFLERMSHDDPFNPNSPEPIYQNRCKRAQYLLNVVPENELNLLFDDNITREKKDDIKLVAKNLLKCSRIGIVSDKATIHPDNEDIKDVLIDLLDRCKVHMESGFDIQL